jgi:hypothetical protein
MDLRRVADWTLLPGTSVEIRQLGTPVSGGHVDAVTDDGKILWLLPPAGNRRLFEKAEFYEAWAAEDRDGFHYEVAKGLESPADNPLPAQ